MHACLLLLEQCRIYTVSTFLVLVFILPPGRIWPHAPSMHEAPPTIPQTPIPLPHITGGPGLWQLWERAGDLFLVPSTTFWSKFAFWAQGCLSWLSGCPRLSHHPRILGSNSTLGSMFTWGVCFSPHPFPQLMISLSLSQIKKRICQKKERKKRKNHNKDLGKTVPANHLAKKEFKQH